MSELSDDEVAAFMQTIGRLSQHLPRPPAFDATGTAWVIDPVLIILKRHLLVEAALVDICSRLLANPAALEKENVKFSTRLNLVRALTDDDKVPEPIWHALRDLNAIRNRLVHNLEPEDIQARLCKFVKGLEDFDEHLRPLLRNQKGTPERLTTCIIYLSGLRVGKPADELGGEDGG